MEGVRVESRTRVRRVRSRTVAPSAGWRERLISRCLDRAKESRYSLVSDARRRAALLRELRYAGQNVHVQGDSDGLSDEEVELGSWRKDRTVFQNEEDEDLSLSESELDALVLELEAAIEEERRREEEDMLMAAANELYVTSQADDDIDVQELSAFQSQLCLDPAESFVLCPACERNRLLVHHGTVFCNCGLRISGGSSDNITLEMVRSRLADLLDEHNARKCARKPIFLQKDVLALGFTFLHVNCEKCDWDAIAF